MSDSNTYLLKRENFGQKINFKNKDDNNTKNCFKPDPSRVKEYEYKNPKTITLSNITEKSSHLIHTEKTTTKSVLVKHVEGGWPESVKDLTEPRELTNWKRGKEKADDFPIKVKTLIMNTTQIIKQNLRMDIYEDIFNDKHNLKTEDNFSAKIKTVFKDIIPYKRTVNKVVWSTDDEQSKIAIAYRLVKDQKQEIPTNYKLPVN
jgi:hypothetical protein